MNKSSISDEASIFEKIIAREIPASIIYEDDSVISFLDINPINKGHALVVPKKKFVNIFDGDPEVLGHMMQVAQKLSVSIKNVVGANGVNILMNNEKAAGQDVFHAHLHVIPRYEKDEAFQPTHNATYSDYEINKLAHEIKKTLTE